MLLEITLNDLHPRHSFVTFSCRSSRCPRIVYIVHISSLCKRDIRAVRKCRVWRLHPLRRISRSARFQSRSRTRTTRHRMANCTSGMGGGVDRVTGKGAMFQLNVNRQAMLHPGVAVRGLCSPRSAGELACAGETKSVRNDLHVRDICRAR